MVKTFKIAWSRDFSIKVCEVLHIDPDLTGKIVIDMTPQAPIIVTVQIFAPEELSNIDLSNFTDAIEAEAKD